MEELTYLKMEKYLHSTQGSIQHWVRAKAKKEQITIEEAKKQMCIMVSEMKEIESKPDFEFRELRDVVYKHFPTQDTADFFWINYLAKKYKIGEPEGRRGRKVKIKLQHEKECLVCKSPYVEDHHVFFGRGKRQLSEKYGLKVWLCYRHHRDSKAGVHFNKTLDTKIKQMAQREFEAEYTREQFIQIFGRNYLDD